MHQRIVRACEFAGRLTAEGHRHLPTGRGIEELFPPPTGNLSRFPSRPVVRITDGKIFPSAYAASMSLEMSPVAVSQAIKRKVPVGGHRWRFADGASDGR